MTPGLLLVVGIMMIVPPSLSHLVVVLDLNDCWNCSDPLGCREEVVGGKLAGEAVRWTVDRVGELGGKDAEGLSLVDTCSDEKTAVWSVVRTLVSLEPQTNLTGPPSLLLASAQLNYQLAPALASLQLPVTILPPTSPRGLARAASKVTQRLGWTQVAVLADPGTGEHLGHMMAEQDICVVDLVQLPSSRAPKDSYTSLLSSLDKVGVDKVLVSGVGRDIARLARNVFELNLAISILALPSDGPVKGMPGSDFEIATIFQLVPTYHEMPEFMSDHKDEYESPLSWQLARTVYGLLVHQESAVDDVTAREGLQVTREMPRFRIELLEVHSARWQTVGLYEAGEVSWTNTSRWTSNLLTSHCEWCECVNGALTGQGSSWRWESWVSALASLAGLGGLCCLALAVFLGSQCGQVLEGAQWTTSSLLLATLMLYTSLLPFCLQPSSLVCALRSLGPPATYTLTISTMLARSLLLATSDTDGLPGHASGFLQVVLFLLLVSVEVGLLVQGALLRQTEYVGLTRQGRMGLLVCADHGWPWLSQLVWPAALLLLQLGLLPAIWSSRRNYKEGVLFSLASLGASFVTGAWVTVYLFCTDLYGAHWEDIAVCAGLVSTATIILLVVFVPKVYLMTMWGVSKEVTGDLKMPGTTTSTLHTDTIDYVRGQDLYRIAGDQHVRLVGDQEKSLQYNNLPRNRKGLQVDVVQSSLQGTQCGSSHGGSPSLPLGVVGLPGLNGPPQSSTYKLDLATEAEPNISWQPFKEDQREVSSLFASNLAGYGYHKPSPSSTKL